MARKINFRSRIIETLEENNAFEFQKLFKEKLNQKLNEKKLEIVRNLIEENDSESFMANSVIGIARSFGGEHPLYDMGVLIVSFSSMQGAEHFTDALKEIDYIDNIEIEGSGNESEDGSPTDLEYEGATPHILTTVYFNLDNIPLTSDIDGYLEGLGSMAEEIRKEIQNAILEACKKKTESDESEDDSEDDDDEDEDDSEEDGDEDEDDMEDDSEDDEETPPKKMKKESYDFLDIMNKKPLNEFMRIKTAKFNKLSKKVLKVSKVICPPGKTGADCSIKLTPERKQELRVNLKNVLKKLSHSLMKKARIKGVAVSNYIKANNLQSVSGAKVKLGR